MGSPNEKLRAALREADPAAGGGLSEAERQDMRRRVLAAAGERRRSLRLLPVALTAGAVLLVASVVGVWLQPRPGHHLPATAPAPLPSRSLGAPSPLPAVLPEVAAKPTLAAPLLRERERPTVLPPATQQLHFVTAGGTQIIWVLNPKFSL